MKTEPRKKNRVKLDFLDLDCSLHQRARFSLSSFVVRALLHTAFVWLYIIFNSIVIEASKVGVRRLALGAPVGANGIPRLDFSDPLPLLLRRLYTFKFVVIRTVAVAVCVTVVVEQYIFHRLERFSAAILSPLLCSFSFSTSSLST